MHMPIYQLAEPLPGNDLHLRDAAVIPSLDVQVNAVLGLIIHIDTAVIVIDGCNGLSLVVPQLFLFCNPDRDVFRARLQALAGCKRLRAAPRGAAVFLSNRTGPFIGIGFWDGSRCSKGCHRPGNKRRSSGKR